MAGHGGARLGIARLSKEPGISRFRLVAFHQQGMAGRGRAGRGKARQGSGRMKGTADRPLSRTMRRCASMGTRARRGLAPPGGFFDMRKEVMND